MDRIKGKKILITNYSIAEFAGSEINCLSLALQFKKMGAIVEVATFNFGEPIREKFEKSEIIVTNILLEELKEKSYDLIWAHHTIVLDYLIFIKQIKGYKIIFSSLSPFEPLEVAPYYANELTLCLANSEETRKKILEENVEESNIYVFPNYVDEEFFKYTWDRRNDLPKKVAIVSNHLPIEEIQLIDLLREDGVEVDIYGVGYIQTLITPEILIGYDLIISIGKTVQYAMAMGIPLYCYDIHGGPGWIDEKNIYDTFNTNFSGRGFKRYLAEEIYVDLLKGYSHSKLNLIKLKEFVRKYCSLEKNLNIILEEVFKSNIGVNLDEVRRKYQKVKRSNEALVREYKYNMYRRIKINEITNLNTQLQTEKIDYQNEINNINDKTNLQALENEKQRLIIEEQNQKINDLLEKIDISNKVIEEKEIIIVQQQNELKNKENVIREVSSTLLNRENLIKEISKQLENKRETIMEKEQEILQIKKEILERENIINQQIKELEQKEANCKYLLELNAEKDMILNEIYSCRGWKALDKYRRVKKKFKKAIKNPKLVIKKLRLNPVLSLEDKRMSDKDIENYDDLVSVVIPIYDRTDVLIQSIESILNQSYDNIELILVCDGSPQSTLDIVKQYEQHPKVRVFYYKDNSGNAVRGRNKAIREARGRYFAFQDSDDIAEQDRIKISIEYMRKYDVDVVYGGWRALVDGSRKINIEDGQEIFSPDCNYDMLKEICVPCQSTVMAKTEALRTVGGLKTTMRYREDHELWLRLAYSGYKFKAINEILTNLRLHENNLELTFKDEDNKWFNIMLEEHTKLIKMKPKIAYLIPGCGISGGIAVICQHINRLQKRGYEVLIITEDDNTTIDWFPNQNVDIVTMENVPTNIDILVATGWSTAYTAQHINANKKYYFVQSDESRFYEKESYEYRRALETYKMDYEIITEAKWIQKWLKEEFGKEAHYVPNGLDEKIIHKTQPMVPKGEKLRILLEGPIDIPFKGMEDAFNAINGLDCEVWCISSAGRPKPEWHCDRFFEKVPMEQMKYIYSSCDIFLKMSRVEGFFGPPLEMMACGGACVVSKVTGYDEYITNEYNALVVEQGDVEGAHQALRRLLEDQVLRQQLVMNGYKTASEWKWEPSIDILENIYSNK
ncbi:glycosyltransferase [Zhenhengia yiwuensis]|uniref:Glycosyltransferase n=1 Tax=Zhenhengia yiwuensis TaxID=2763666 RepID=A0A926ICQ3_9FIRM|nr:glycosyltransferase [Zhenhengia yiwuensis]MBC8578932.1 glycosyltransferase [Zhenhengia yiwuensis]